MIKFNLQKLLKENVNSPKVQEYDRRQYAICTITIVRL